MAREVRLRASRTPYRRAGLALGSSPIVIALVDLTGAQLVKLVRDPVVTVEIVDDDGASQRVTNGLGIADDAELATFFDEAIAREAEAAKPPKAPKPSKLPDPAASVLPKEPAGASPAGAPTPAGPSPAAAAAPAEDTNTQRESPAATDASAPAGGVPAPSTDAGVVAAAAAEAANGGGVTQAAPAEAQQEATATPPVVEAPKPVAGPVKAAKPKATASRKGKAKQP